jgi:hypothetical protein
MTVGEQLRKTAQDARNRILEDDMRRVDGVYKKIVEDCMVAAERGLDAHNYNVQTNRDISWIEPYRKMKIFNMVRDLLN